MLGAHRYGAGSKKLKKRRKIAAFMVIVMGAAALSAFGFFRAFDAHLLPAAVEISEMRAQARIAAVISESVERAVESGGLNASDFYEITFDNAGDVAALTVNSILVSSLCSRLAEEVTAVLSSMPEEGIYIPWGALTGVPSLANLGPRYKVRLMPTGGATVDYSSSFTQAGINQTNFKIWVQADAKLKIVNPVQDVVITAERKILLVDAVINGAVPRYVTPNPL